MRFSSDTDDVAIAVGYHVIAGRYLPERLRRVHIAGMVPDRPKGSVLPAQPPQSNRLHSHLPRGAQLIQCGHGVQHPDLVAYVIVFIIVSKMGIELVAG